MSIDSNEEVTIRIIATNASKPGIDEARQGLKQLEGDAGKASAKTLDAADSTDIFAAAWQVAAIGAIAGGAAILATLAADAVKTADTLVTLSAKTGLSTEMLQRMNYVAVQSGSTMESYANVVFRMGVNVAKGGDQTKEAVEKMGLSWEQFRRLSPEQMFLAIVDNIHKVDAAGERNAVLTAIAGRGVGDAVAGMVQNYRELASEAVVSNDAQIRELASYQQAYDGFVANVKASSMKFFGAVAIGVRVDQLLQEGLATWLLTGKGLTEFFDAYGQGLKSTSRLVDELAVSERRLATSLLEQGHSVKEVAAWTNTSERAIQGLSDALAGAKPVQRDYVAELRDAKTALAELAPAERAQLVAAVAGTDSTKELAEAFGLSEAAIKLFKDQLRESEQQTKKAETEQRKFRDALKEIESATVSLTSAQREEILALKARSVSEADIATALKLTGTQVRQVIDQDKERIKVAEESDKVMAKVVKNRIDEQQRIREANEKTGLKRMELEVALYEVLQENDARVAVLRLTGTARELEQIRQAEAAAIAAAQKKYGTHVDLLAQEVAAITSRYDHERDLVNQTQATVVERMRAAGFATREDLQTSAAAAKLAYDQMRTSGEFSIGELNRKRDEWIAKELAAADAMSGLWHKAFAGLPAVILGAIAGGGDVGRAIGAHVGTQLADELGKRAAEDLIKSGHTKLAGAVTSLMGPLGSLAGDVFSAALGKVFGTKGRDEVKKFAESVGGFDELRAKLIPLGDEGERLWKILTQGVGKNNPEQARQAIEAVTKALELQESVLRKYEVQWFELGGTARSARLAELIEGLTAEQEALTIAGLSSEAALRKQSKAYNDLLAEAMRTGEGIPPALLPTILRLAEMGELTEANTRLLLGMAEDTRPGLKELEEAAGTLGIKVSDLGTRYDQLKFDEATDRYMKAFETLARGGMDVNEAIAKMSQETIDAINVGVRLGREFPDGMRGVLEAMREQGKLTDENGQKLEDLSNVTFAQSLTEGMSEVVDKLKELIDAILGVPSAISKIPKSFDIDVNFKGTRSGDWPEHTGGGGIDGGEHTQAFASGGIAYGPLHARIEPGRKEIIGDQTFMQQALVGAIDRLGGLNAFGGGGGGEITIVMPMYFGTEQFDERIVRVGQAALQGQVWQVPQTVLAGRPRF